MHEEAVDCHLRGGNPKAAVDCCVLLNRWDVALDLAEKHDFPQVLVHEAQKFRIIYTVIVRLILGNPSSLYLPFSM